MDQELIEIVKDFKFNSMLIGLVAGILGGIISPLILSFLKHKVIWQSQKKIEIKKAAFDDAVKALSMYSTDALSPEIQNAKTDYKGVQRVVGSRIETDEMMEKSRGLVQAFFSQEAYRAFDEALRTKISINEIPNIEFESKRVRAILLLSKELGMKFS